MATGLSHPPFLCLGRFYQLGRFCRVVRGVAGGANDFFMRDISGDEITTETIAALDCRASRAANIPAFHFDALWRILNHPTNTPLVAKTYGSGALKVEPRALEQLPILADPVRDKPRCSAAGKDGADGGANVSAASGLTRRK